MSKNKEPVKGEIWVQRVRISNVKFVTEGQENEMDYFTLTCVNKNGCIGQDIPTRRYRKNMEFFTDPDDPRFLLSYVRIGEVGELIKIIKIDNHGRPIKGTTNPNLSRENFFKTYFLYKNQDLCWE